MPLLKFNERESSQVGLAQHKKAIDLTNAYLRLIHHLLKPEYVKWRVYCDSIILPSLNIEKVEYVEKVNFNDSKILHWKGSASSIGEEIALIIDTDPKENDSYYRAFAYLYVFAYLNLALSYLPKLLGIISQRSFSQVLKTFGEKRLEPVIRALSDDPTAHLSSLIIRDYADYLQVVSESTLSGAAKAFKALLGLEKKKEIAGENAKQLLATLGVCRETPPILSRLSEPESPFAIERRGYECRPNDCDEDSEKYVKITPDVCWRLNGASLYLPIQKASWVVYMLLFDLFLARALERHSEKFRLIIQPASLFEVDQEEILRRHLAFCQFLGAVLADVERSVNWDLVDKTPVLLVAFGYMCEHEDSVLESMLPTATPRFS